MVIFRIILFKVGLLVCGRIGFKFLVWCFFFIRRRVFIYGVVLNLECFGTGRGGRCVLLRYCILLKTLRVLFLEFVFIIRVSGMVFCLGEMALDLFYGLILSRKFEVGI